MDVKQFYDSFKDTYTESVRRANPIYDAMFGAIADYLPSLETPETILELGCGTGNLTLLLQAHFPQTRIVGTDISADMLDICRQRARSSLLELRAEDMRQSQAPDGTVDAVCSSLAVHHLVDAEKQDLFQRISRWLRPGGWLVLCDRFLDESPITHAVNRQKWYAGAMANGTTEAEWATWLQHEAAHDHPGSLMAHTLWLKAAGFATTDVVWRKYLWGVVYAQKRSAPLL